MLFRSEWHLFLHGSSGNTALLAALYAVLEPDPAWFIPFNAGAHAAGALLIYQLGPRIWPGYPGQAGGLIAGIVFLVFPSSLQWYGQNHKDAFAILGTLLVLEAWLRCLPVVKISVRNLLQLMIQTTVGAVLVGLFRPYYVVLLLAGTGIAWIADVICERLRQIGRAHV